VIIAENEKILLFDINGKFICSIGSKGQGPGEYISIKNVSIDENNKILFINARKKIICYDLNGNYLKEFFINQKDELIIDRNIIDMNYINDELLIIIEQIDRKDKGRFNHHSTLFLLNFELKIVDSCDIRDNYFEKAGWFNNIYENAIFNLNSNVYLYYSDLYYEQQNPLEAVLRDTFYHFENNKLIPELRLKFKNDGIDASGKKYIHLYNIFKSSRYVFACYFNSKNNNLNYFCYDTKTERGYNMIEGYTDDINKIEKRVEIRPLILNTDLFYYWHTNMKPDDIEEPNPTLYIGTLKK